MNSAVRNYERWIAEDRVAELTENYALLSNPAHRRKILTWAVSKAREGNLRPLLGIGIEDAENSMRRCLDSLLETLPANVLLAKVAEGQFTNRERRTVAGLLGRCREPQAGRILAMMTTHPDAQVRASAIQALTHFPATRGLQFPIFVRVLERDPNSAVRLRAAEGLEHLGTPESLVAIEKAAMQKNATPDIQAVQSRCQARLRTRAMVNAPEEPVPTQDVKKKKPGKSPVGLIIMLCVTAAAIAFVVWRLKAMIRF